MPSVMPTSIMLGASLRCGPGRAAVSPGTPSLAPCRRPGRMKKGPPAERHEVVSLAARLAWHRLAPAVAPKLCAPRFREVCSEQRSCQSFRFRVSATGVDTLRAGVLLPFVHPVRPALAGRAYVGAPAQQPIGFVLTTKLSRYRACDRGAPSFQ